MIDINKLQLVARSDTAIAVLKFFSKRERISNETTIETLKALLSRNGYQINIDDFYRLFRDLEAAGAGVIVQVDSTTKKFIWHYSLRDISDQILEPNREVEIHPVSVENKSKGKRGRPAGYKVSKSKPVKSTISRAPQKPVQQLPNKDVVIMFSTSSGEIILLSLKDAEKIAEQVKAIKQKIS